MRLLSTIVITAFAASSLAQTWYTNPANGHNYRFTIGTDLSWADSETEAIGAGGHLVTINNQAEETWLESTFVVWWYWIGYTDDGTPGTWRWVSGETPTFTNWNPGEPSGDGYWAGMTYPQNPGWNDFPESYRMPGVIEVVPEPAAIAILGLGLALITKRRRHR